MKETKERGGGGIPKDAEKDDVFWDGDPYGIRTHVTAVKGPCLNHLTNGPFVKKLEKNFIKRLKALYEILVAAPGFEPGTLRV